MAIELPKFESSYGLIMTACGQLKGAKIKKRKEVKQEETKVARYKTSSGTAFLRACLIKRHLHIDCALKRCFSEGRAPKVTHKKSEVLSIIEDVMGLGIDAHLIACFDVPLVELPETGLIRSLLLEQKAADMSVELTGATLVLTGAPINKIEWSTLHENKKTLVHIRMEGERTVTVSEKYLSESWDWINEQFSLFVLGKSKDARV